MARPSGIHEDDDLVVLAALGALAPDEARQAEEHIAADPQLAAELRRHLEVLAAIAPEQAPPDHVRARVLEACTTGDRAAAPVSLDDRRARSRRPVARAALAVAAAIALVVVGIGLGRMTGGDDVEDVDALAAAALDDPDAAVLTLRAGATGEGDAVGEVALLPGGQGYVVTTGLPELGDDEAYQLWMLPEAGADPVSSGLVVDGVAAFHLPPGAAGVALSREPASGSVAPTTVVAVAPLA
jgi:anti-sigma-K factor RskA